MRPYTKVLSSPEGARLEAKAAGYSANITAIRRRNNMALGASLVVNVLAVLGIVISRAKL